ncbi:uncharacterized protein LOC127277316 [Leptopilina boulardi]|uniref:uncharacterized protein LOC127277316 n=1 Tax=Leptopilina boulardi TaxID=63433 RepID=UPI0021F52286|nr:uncharacterized protein LOC127277316 [Leptopilina boulardi]
MIENPQKMIKKIKKDQDGVKECLRSDEGTRFQLLIAKLRNTNRNSYWNQEMNKTQYRVSNLPVGIDPNETTFGKSYQFDGGFAEIMKSMITDINEDPKKGLKMDKIERHECSFDKLQRFGKKSDGNWEGLRAKKLLQWINPDPVTKVICLQADFYKSLQPRIGKVKNHDRNLKTEHLPINFTFGKQTNPNRLEVSETLKQSLSINQKLKNLSKCFRNINKIRIILKRRNEISFTKIEEELQKFDKDGAKIVNIKILFDVLKKFRIFPEKELFCELLKILKYLHEDNVNYPEAINLFNWNCNFPEIPKLEEEDLNNYLTTYNKTIGNFPEKNLQSTVKWNQNNSLKYNQLITTAEIIPTIFTNFGLTHEDLVKPQSKETIQSIIKKLKDFPEEKFDSILKEGLKIDKTGGVCILTFKSLLEKLLTKMNETTTNREIK